MKFCNFGGFVPVILVLISFAAFAHGNPAGENKTNDTLKTIAASLILIVIFTVLGCILSFYCCGNWFRTPWSSACCCCCREPSDPEDDQPSNQERTKLIPKHIGGDSLKDAPPQEPATDLPLDILEQIIPNEDQDAGNETRKSATPPPALPESPAPSKLIRAPAFEIETEPTIPVSKRLSLIPPEEQ